ncbi:MAG: dihydroneopterin aldolase [Lentisphaeria bacterium]|jgi:dihydroneopterin aldolase|nr:dihydroneopterin aldolase [Lentisphaeria bacterium]
MDKIQLTGLRVRTIIGTLPHERITPQTLILSADLYSDFSAAEASDDFHDTFDYAAVEAFLHDFTAASSYQLLEALAGNLANAVLKEFPLIAGIRLRISKPSAPRYAELVTIEVTRGTVS